MTKSKFAFAAAAMIAAFALAAPGTASAGALNGFGAAAKSLDSGVPLTVEVSKGRRRALGLGIAGAIVGGIIINEAVRADERRLARECRRLDRACAAGNRRACYIFDEECL